MAAIGHQHGVNRVWACAAAVCLAAVASLLPVNAVHAQPMYFPTMGQDWGWTHIGQPGNPAYDGRFGAPGNGFTDTAGRGRVNHEFFIQTGQLTIGQWLEFANTIASNPANFALSAYLNRTYSFSPSPPIGILADVNYPGPGNRQYASAPWLLDRPMVLNWREAALIANWLHHDRTNDLSLCLSGAYDISSWGGPGAGFTITDDAHLPGARFWIPSLDEWLKAAFWDNNRLGPGQGDWRQFSYGDAGPSSPHWRGMRDLGTGREWTETPLMDEGQQYGWMVMDYSTAESQINASNWQNFQAGGISVRFASSIPSVSTGAVWALGALALGRRWRQRCRVVQGADITAKHGVVFAGLSACFLATTAHGSMALL